MSLHIERNASQIEIVVSARGGHAALLATIAAHTQSTARPGLRLRARGDVLRVSLPCRGEAEDAALLRALRRARHDDLAGVRR